MNTEKNKLPNTFQTFTISSTCGNLIVDRNTGEILSSEMYRPGHIEYSYLDNIKRFDIKRYIEAHYGRDMPKEVDILKFGYWNKNGSYENPADGYEPNPQ